MATFLGHRHCHTQRNIIRIVHQLAKDTSPGGVGVRPVPSLGRGAPVRVGVRRPAEVVQPRSQRHEVVSQARGGTVLARGTAKLNAEPRLETK